MHFRRLNTMKEAFDWVGILGKPSYRWSSGQVYIYGLLLWVFFWPTGMPNRVSQQPTVQFYHSGKTLISFLFYRQWFPRYRLIYKSDIFGHETIGRSSTYILFLRQWVEIQFIFALLAAVYDTGIFSKLPYMGMKFGHRLKFQKLHIYLPPPLK